MVEILEILEILEIVEIQDPGLRACACLARGGNPCMLGCACDPIC
jgi:hypothetical protein